MVPGEPQAWHVEVNIIHGTEEEAEEEAEEATEEAAEEAAEAVRFAESGHCVSSVYSLN